MSVVCCCCCCLSLSFRPGSISPQRPILGIGKPLSHVREQLEIQVELQDWVSDG